MPRVSSMPMLAVPACGDRARLPTPPMVVSELTMTARAELVARMLFPSGRSVRYLWIIWMPLSTPMPSSRGRAMTLAKFSGSPASTLMAPVTRAAVSSGISTRNTSLLRVRSMNSISVMAANAYRNACLNAAATASLASRLFIGAPVTSGETDCTARTNFRNALLSCMSCFG